MTFAGLCGHKYDDSKDYMRLEKNHDERNF